MLIATLTINNFLREFIHSLYINKPNSSASLEDIWWLRKENWLLPSKTKQKNKMMMLGTINYFTDCFAFGVLVNVGKKIMCQQCRFKSWHDSRDNDCDYDVINVHSCKRHTVVHHAFCVLGDSLCSFLASRLTTVSLDK